MTIIASISVLIIFSIPHSMYGLELYRTSGEVAQGFITFFWSMLIIKNQSKKNIIKKKRQEQIS